MAGDKLKFDQINRGVNQNLFKLQWVDRNFHKLQEVKFFMKVQNQINFKLQERNLKNILQGRKLKMNYITKGKTLLTLSIIYL